MLLALFLGGVTITLNPDATVRGTEIQLAQVATVDGTDPDEVARVLREAGVTDFSKYQLDPSAELWPDYFL